jgi:hypothetical protein
LRSRHFVPFLICLFFAEAKAAQEAGLKAVIVVREGNEPLTEEDKVNFPVIKSFHDCVFEVSAKRKKTCANDDSPASGPISETSNSSSSEKIKAEEKTEVPGPHTAGSGNTGSSSDDFEMKDISNNDAQVTDKQPGKTEMECEGTDDTKMAVENSDIKESEKIDLETDDSKVSKTESSSPESRTVVTADVGKDSPKLCSKNVEECDSKDVPDTSLTKLSAEVEVSKVDIDVKLNYIKADEKDSKIEIVNTEAENAEMSIKGIVANGEEMSVNAEETEAVSTSTQDKNVKDRTSKNNSGAQADLEALSEDSKNRSVGTESVSLESESEAPEISAENGKSNVCEVVKVDASDNEDKVCVCKVGSSDVKGDSSNEDANVEEMKADTENNKLAVNSTEIEGKMETDSAETENVKAVDANDVKGKGKVGINIMATEGKDEITKEMEMGSSAKLEENDVAVKKVVCMESGGIGNGKEKGENAEPAGDSAINEENGVTKLESEVSNKTESDILHQASEKLSVSDSSINVSPSQTENNKYASGGSKYQETSKAQYSLANTNASLEDCKTEEGSKEPKSADKLLQEKVVDISHTIKNEDSELITTSDNNSAKEAAGTNEDTKPLESKNEDDDDQSKTTEDTAKENGLVFTAENGKGDITNNCPDAKQNVEVTDEEQEIKVKKLSIDVSGNSSVTKDDAATSIAASGSS